MEKEIKLAVLIDAENISAKYIKYIFEELPNHGVPTYKRIYGDWTDSHTKNWKDTLLEYSITPIQQYGYTVGKNSTDSALIIDAMDILYSKNVDGFCIVSSDSDFTKLASRLRESGKLVVGMGEKKTPRPFIVACERFKYLETLLDAFSDTSEDEKNAKIVENKDDIKTLTNSIRSIITDISDDEGWANMSSLGNMLSKRFPDFDVRNYGYSKLTPLISSLGNFEIKSVKSADSHVVHKLVKIKQKKR
ncbi:putative nuclease of putative toxin-antitoxin system [Breznakia sp. PF5-3]|uniref:NYN domain-containing protein n=1 Tax=unclassified Breznakia TaxID=2623764 RepID=UPI0024073C11|nr:MULTISPECIES: NYN domain-containing protein [unclassified Breznakia]MDF9825892.1 putative nuclease of putative toxin-antitoxin system [Breznakia sp. PM6-1]MDF9836689.1 putative nuclease of putative toxin-antitoxin system [Breznakia sp. PF5-3]MDF9838967.1 putative nuclease of putative toxin-antitoxin system [Breznakia sp. PFB2-8]MDF9860983.1 putative nuclease of putative toxin-antitoxin system [Breznakia sp. PH5-24]